MSPHNMKKSNLYGKNARTEEIRIEKIQTNSDKFEKDIIKKIRMKKSESA